MKQKYNGVWFRHPLNKWSLSVVRINPALPNLLVSQGTEAFKTSEEFNPLTSKPNNYYTIHNV
ncbi:hypothetical protein VPLG_00019 [Vibrio phage eugene 12A10]|uniref:hypothetical protein n=1 Tax=Vibrio phage eugene 12A10 TaxID=573172 RepID=UPI0003517598|nr:hypothetical protein VPLG_00019 [Vibrio phage eugene 12A10]AGN51458.1 hypothetical protein VPLG_00019 [Vibrio phage eugene 12A10]